ncbi:MAG: GNAT family N-acetyltransferase [Synergistaceae bacterium]|jgi:N-acetylglutamate synthase-like GNAT family acetyltransferase|nr:GNAT family N-acetyltransferase [Synergistaceae bacterium]
MDPDDTVIRPARLDEADILSHICFRARSYWEYSRELLSHWDESGALSISSEEIEEHPVYVAEDAEEGEILGFYSMRVSGDECGITNLCVLPELVGTEIRSMLFLHACEIAEASGACFVTVLSDQLASGFFEEMGAERVGEKIIPSPVGDRALAVFKLNL